MKKLFFLGALFAVGLGFTACSSDKDVADVNGPIENAGENYLAISINLPTNSASATRADDNADHVTFDDGLDAEYEVKDVTLLVFSKETGNAFKKAYSLSKDGFTKDGTDKQVTSHGTKIIQMVGTSVVAGDLALVVINNNDLFTLDGNDIKFGENKFTGTYAEFQAKTASTSGLDASSMMGSGKGFYMANAPLSDKQGSTTTAPTGANVRVLVPITTVYKTYAEAEAGAADQIYVERGMAKVTMNQAIETATLSNSKVGGAALTATLDGWILDNCNSTSYLVRSTEGHDDFVSLHSVNGGIYRYIGNAQITYPTIPAYPYRTYFAKSTNYTGGATLNRVLAPVYYTAEEASTYNNANGLNEGDAGYVTTATIKTPGTAFSDQFGDNNPQYCFENTFNVANQIVSKTTLVQLKVTAKVGSTAEDLYTAGGNKTNIYTQTTIKELIAGAAYNYIVSQGWVKEGTFSSKDITVDLTTVSKTTNEVTAVTISYDTATDTSEGDATLKKEAFGTTADATSGSFVAAVNTNALSTVGTVLKYVGGVSYYHIRIKHFGDGLTPWNNGEYGATAPSGNTIATIYPANGSNQDNNYLGRYGVLRNNWYDLKIKSINYLGDAVPKTGNWPDTPDDELDNYITFQINILSWAKRPTQNAEL